MKTTQKITLLLACLFISGSSFGADRFVYPNAQSPDFSTIQAAIDGSNNGDNIYIDTAQFIGNVNINKSLNFYPLHKGGMYTINGALTLSLVANRTIYIQGLNGGGVTSSYSGSSLDSATVILNGCEFSSSVSINSGYSIRSFVYYSTFNDYVTLDACELIGNTFAERVYIYANGYSSNPYPPNIKIYANNFESHNNDQLFINQANGCNIHIANNYFDEIGNDENIYITGSSSSLKAGQVIIENNIFRNNYASTSYYIQANYCEFLFIRNNYFDNTSSYIGYSKSIYTSSIDIYDMQYNFTNGTNFGLGSGTIQTIANNSTATTLYYYTTNSQNYLGNVTSSNGINSGSPLPECRDINNTQNDIGTYGGPHSWSNYHNNSNSMAQILDLEIPYYQIVLPGTQIEFKSKAIHKNE